MSYSATYCMSWPDFWVSSGNGSGLALVHCRKVSPPQGEPQINDQGRRLSAGLHASCPIHHQTCQGTLPLGILEIFMEHFHHFYLLLIGSEHWSSPSKRCTVTETGQGVEVWWVEVLKPKWLHVYTWATSPGDRAALWLPWQPPYSPPPSCSCAAGH